MITQTSYNYKFVKRTLQIHDIIILLLISTIYFYKEVLYLNNKEMGVILRIDELGRLVLPKPVREAYGIRPNSQICLQPMKEGFVRITAPTGKSPPTI